MAGENISPYMSLPIPAVGITAGPLYASDLNSCLTRIDQHDHSSGNGVLINPGGMDISSDLDMENNNLTNIRSLRLYPQASALVVATDIRCLYAVAGDLYYNNSARTAVQITTGGSVAGSSGTITGLTSPASATYTAISTTVAFQSAVNTAASVDCRNLVLRNATVSSFGLTISPPAAMGADVAITMPSLPVASNLLAIDSAGAISAFTTTTNPNFPGKAAQEGSKNLVVSNTNATNSLAIIRIYSGGTGTILAGEGATVVQGTPGQYTVNYTTAFGDVPSVSCIVENQINMRVAQIANATSAGCNIFIFDSTGGTHQEQFQFIAIGQRA